MIPHSQPIRSAGILTSGTLTDILTLTLVFALIGCSSSKPPPAPPPAITLAQTLTSRAEKLSQQGNWPAARDAWQKATDQYRLLNNLPALASALHHLGVAQEQSGDLPAAVSTLTRAAQLNETLQRLPLWWRNQIALLQVESKAGLSSALAARFQSLTPSAQQLDDPQLSGLFLTELGLFQESQGQPVEAMDSFTRAQPQFETARSPFGIASAQANQARLHAARNEHAQALTLWTRALATFESLANPTAITLALAGQGRALLALGQNPDHARELLLRAAENYRTLNRPTDQKTLLDLLQSIPPTATPTMQ